MRKRKEKKKYKQKKNSNKEQIVNRYFCKLFFQLLLTNYQLILLEQSHSLLVKLGGMVDNLPYQFAHSNLTRLDNAIVVCRILVPKCK